MLFWGIFDIFGNFGSQKQPKNENKEKCRTTFLEKSIKSNYNKNEVFSTNTETPIFFFPKSKLKISYFQNVWKFLYILPYVTREKYHNFCVERDSLLL